MSKTNWSALVTNNLRNVYPINQLYGFIQNSVCTIQNAFFGLALGPLHSLGNHEAMQQ